MIEKWGAKLAGSDFDLSDWREELKEPFDPYVELISRDNDRLNVLWSKEFVNLETADEVRQRAIGLIHQLNGIMYLQRRCQPLVFGGSARLVDGKVLVDHFVELPSATIRMRGNAIMVQIVRDGVVQPPPPPVKSTAQTLLETAGGDDVVADIFGYISSAIDWYDLYKVIELCESKLGGEHSLGIAVGGKAKPWKAAKTTANFFRHARAYRPETLMPFGEAKDVVLSIVRLIL
mgnify:CR=1 FL=1